MDNSLRAYTLPGSPITDSAVETDRESLSAPAVTLPTGNTPADDPRALQDAPDAPDVDSDSSEEFQGAIMHWIPKRTTRPQSTASRTPLSDPSIDTPSASASAMLPERQNHRMLASTPGPPAELEQQGSGLENSRGMRTPRPPPEVVYERFEEYFPGHDLDRPEIGTSQDDTSSLSPVAPAGCARPVVRWLRGELISKAAYNAVYLALDTTTGVLIAVKEIELARTRTSGQDDANHVRPVGALMDLSHPNVVQYLGFEESPTILSIFMEYVPGGSITDCLRKYGPFPEDLTKSFTRQILSGLEYLHSQGFVHRDLKGDNVLVDHAGTCRLSNFDFYKRTDDVTTTCATATMHGSVFWMAPEVVNAKGKSPISKIDIWSAGCVVHEMWTGERPWLGREATEVLLHTYHTKQAPPLPEGVELSVLADDFRRHCFAPDPDDRPSAGELRAHPYLEPLSGWTFSGFK